MKPSLYLDQKSANRRGSQVVQCAKKALAEFVDGNDDVADAVYTMKQLSAKRDYLLSVYKPDAADGPAQGKIIDDLTDKECASARIIQEAGLGEKAAEPIVHEVASRFFIIEQYVTSRKLADTGAIMRQQSKAEMAAHNKLPKEVGGRRVAAEAKEAVREAERWLRAAYMTAHNPQEIAANDAYAQAVINMPQK